MAAKITEIDHVPIENTCHCNARRKTLERSALDSFDIPVRTQFTTHSRAYHTAPMIGEHPEQVLRRKQAQKKIIEKKKVVDAVCSFETPATTPRRQGVGLVPSLIIEPPCSSREQDPPIQCTPRAPLVLAKMQARAAEAMKKEKDTHYCGGVSAEAFQKASAIVFKQLNQPQASSPRMNPHVKLSVLPEGSVNPLSRKQSLVPGRLSGLNSRATSPVESVVSKTDNLPSVRGFNCKRPLVVLRKPQAAKASNQASPQEASL